MITIIDENNLVTEDGVKLVADPYLGDYTGCDGCYFDGDVADGCGKVPCIAANRMDGESVIFVEKNPC